MTKQSTRIVLRNPALAIALKIQDVAGLDSPSAAVALTLTTYGPALLEFLRNPLNRQNPMSPDEGPATSPEITATEAFDSL